MFQHGWLWQTALFGAYRWWICKEERNIYLFMAHITVPMLPFNVCDRGIKEHPAFLLLQNPIYLCKLLLEPFQGFPSSLCRPWCPRPWDAPSTWGCNTGARPNEHAEFLFGPCCLRFIREFAWIQQHSVGNSSLDPQAQWPRGSFIYPGARARDGAGGRTSRGCCEFNNAPDGGILVDILRQWQEGYYPDC